MKSYKRTTEKNDAGNQAAWYSPGTIITCFRKADRIIGHWFDHLISEIESLQQNTQQNQEVR